MHDLHHLMGRYPLRARCDRHRILNIIASGRAAPGVPRTQSSQYKAYSMSTRRRRCLGWSAGDDV